ncbi:hypothetical protein HCN44_008870 [Aphidius gifuensis]|uniref:Uncharacterized protein n=1 Tax=Aphidius gifuensis TaxID=684658 RepID=A0A835CVQ1_APHGI|nr:hypothetical protein HCN44_008870 [Aphidius gifuensis]
MIAKALHTAIEVAKSECLGSLRTTLIMMNDYSSSDQLNAAYMQKISNNADVLEPGQINDVKIQHIWNNLAYRAIDPNSLLPPVEHSLPLPIEATTYIANEKIDSCVEKLKKFPIPKREKDAETLENNSTTAM